LAHKANICSNASVSPLSPGQLDAAARALNRAADQFYHRAMQMDEKVAAA
jgi:hypothetical protein